MRKSLPILLSVPLALSVSLFSNTAEAAPTCVVPAESDPVAAGALLESCVDDVNNGYFDTIDFAVPQTHAIEGPLVLERDVTILGTDQILTPTAGFSGGDSMVVVGTGAATVSADITGMEFQSSGAVTVRAVSVSEGDTAIFDGVSILGFTIGTGDGGGIFGEPASTIVIMSSHLAANEADRGGAVFSDAGDVVIKGGVLNSNEANFGGAVATESAATLSVVEVELLFNSAFNRGGAVHIGPGASGVSFDKTTFKFNEADDDGGAFFGGGDFTSSTFQWNYAHDRGGGAVLGPKSHVTDTTFFENEGYRGGGLAALFDGSHDITVDGCTFEGNHADRHQSSHNQPSGGGLYVARTSGTSPGTMVVNNSTFSGNSSLGAVATYGGGFSLAMVPAYLTHVTFFGNDAVFGAAVHTSASPTSSLQLYSSIVAGSPGAACAINGPFTEDTSLDDDGSCNVTYDSIDPMLAPLADNGGPTKTHLPGASSVLDAATCYATVDQRGVARPSSDCDIGSVEQ